MHETRNPKQTQMFQIQMSQTKILNSENLNFDNLVKSRHSRENGNPEEFQVLKKTGFLLAQE
jgi:hypothetical protein